MRIAIVADIHGNRTALEAVLTDLKNVAPDLVLQGGDLAHGGASPVDVVDRVRDLGWPGVLGNTDEMYFQPESLKNYADSVTQSHPTLRPLFDAIAEMAPITAGQLGPERLEYLRRQALAQVHHDVALVHASPASLWRAPAPDATDDELESTYAPLGKPIAVYCHIHRPYIRRVAGRIVANTGSVGMPFDGDRRASYLLITNGEPEIRRVEYDVERELRALDRSRSLHSNWMRRTLDAASPQPVSVAAQ